MKKQFIAKLLVLAMVLAMVPVTVLAANAAAGDQKSCPDTGCVAYSAPDTTVVTTTAVDASEVTVEDGEAVIEAKVVNGTANVTLNEKAVEKLFEGAEGDTLVLKIEAEGATKVNTSLPAKALTAAGEKTGAALTVELGDVATITIPNEGLSSVFGNSGSVKISAQNSGTNIGFSIQVSGKALKNIKGLKVEF